NPAYRCVLSDVAGKIVGKGAYEIARLNKPLSFVGICDCGEGRIETCENRPGRDDQRLAANQLIVVAENKKAIFHQRSPQRTGKLMLARLRLFERETRRCVHSAVG